MNQNYYVTNFYRFFSVADVALTQGDLENWVEKFPGTLGLIILAPEGLNGTMQFPTSETKDLFKSWLCERFPLSPSDFKDSISDRSLFNHFKVKVRQEIVTLGTPELIPSPDDPSRLTPTQWRDFLKSGKKLNLVDTRNAYEYKIGHFKGAINPDTEQFTELPRQIENLPKDEPLLIYCTGGIRCEKATLEMQRRGFQEVYQLQGGILKYLEEYPHDLFEGECFVFDNRVAVTQDLKPTKEYGLCPHCSDPASVSITCRRCGGHAKVCDDCLKLEVEGSTCSRECQHHFRLKPWQKARRVFARGTEISDKRA